MLGNGPKAFSELMQAKQARPPDTKLDQPIIPSNALDQTTQW